MTKPQKDNKVYCVYVSDGTSHVLGNVKKTTFEGIKFLKGIELRKDTWVNNKNTYINPGKINGMMEFDSFDDYLKSLKIYKKNKKISKAKK